MRQASPDENILHKKCMELGLKITPQRLAIFEEIRYSKEHPSIDMVYRKIKTKFPHISFDTVYRTLITFCASGMVKPVEGYGYTKRFDPNMDRHHHFHCVKCQKIFDFYDPSYDRLRGPAKLKAGFRILNKKVVLEGICPGCK